MTPLVYVVIVNWRGWRDTLACLASLGKLNYPRYKIVVVDNGSGDDSVARIRAAHASVTLLETGCNLGFAGGNNVGIRHALSDGATYIWLLNNDTVVDPNALTAMVAVAEADAHVGAVGVVLLDMTSPDRIQAWGGGHVNMWLGRSRYCAAPTPAGRLDYLSGASMVVRADVFRRIGALDDGFFMYWEDTDFAFRLRRSGYRLAVAEHARVWHKESASTGKNSAVLDAYFSASAVRFFRRYAPLAVVPITIGAGSKILKRVWQGDWERVHAVWHGLRGHPLRGSNRQHRSP
ncbi:MAG TPA: glycosyltransferase family 2 protein [bacterium]|nr:glycosyltransferase family 2 protein [bacterium]